MSEEIQSNSFVSEQWDTESEQNWVNFWDLILKEYIRQNPEEYKKLREQDNEHNRNTNYSHKT